MIEGYPISYPDTMLTEGYQCYPQLLDVERETASILRGVPADLAVSVTLAAQAELPSPEPPMGAYCDAHIPSVVIFSREGKDPEAIWKKLLATLKTPDFDTPSYNPELRPLIDAVKTIIFRNGFADGIVGAIFTNHMIRVASGDPAAINWIYWDISRRSPEFSGDWHETLVKQFRGYLTQESQTADELFALLNQNETFARRHIAAHNRRLPGEDTGSYIARQLEEGDKIFNIGSPGGLGRAAAAMDRVFRDYRKETYALRGIPYEA